MDIAKAVKTGRVKPAYITDKEKSLLLARDRAKGSTSKKFYKGVPVLDGGPTHGADGYGEADSRGISGLFADADWGSEPGGDSERGKGTKDKDYDPGSMGGGGGAAGDIDDEHSTPAIDCRAKGKYWYDSACHDDPPGGKGSGDDEEEEGSLFARKPYEKASSYSYKVPKVDPGTPPSETERVRKKTSAGTPFAESVRRSMVGEVAGVAEKERTIKDMDTKRDFDDAMLAQAQAFAAKGMSFSTSMLNAEQEMVRELARNRLVSADEADKMQEKLDMARWEAAEPIMRLAAEAKLGDAGLGGTFTPGAYDTGKLSSIAGIGIPGFSGLPSTTATEEDELGRAGGDEAKDKDFTDKAGHKCSASEKDSYGQCPTNPSFGHDPEGGGER